MAWRSRRGWGGEVPAGWLSLPRHGFQHESGKEKVSPCNLRKNKDILGAQARFVLQEMSFESVGMIR